MCVCGGGGGGQGGTVNISVPDTNTVKCLLVLFVGKQVCEGKQVSHFFIIFALYEIGATSMRFNMWNLKVINFPLETNDKIMNLDVLIQNHFEVTLETVFCDAESCII